MKKILQAFLLFLFLTASEAYAQTRTVSGVVTGKDDGKPLPGVSVMVQGTKTGTQTGSDGNYSIKVTGKQPLVFTFIGFATQTITPVNDRLNVVLAGTASALNEVVVVGYGTQIKRDNVGSISSVKGADLSEQPVQNFQQSLGGRAAGVQVTIPNGVANTPPVFRIRGTNSINLSSQPLFVIDGIVSQTGDFSGGESGGNALANINPEDIESIEIAKDAASTAIYGSRAANGVVFVTTKKGKKGKSVVSVDSWTGIAKVQRLPKILDASQYVDVKNEALKNANLYNASTRYFALSTDAGGNPINTNWFDYVYRTGVTNSNTVSISGANDNTSYYMSANYTNQENTIVKNNFIRKNIMLNMDHKANKIITVGGKLSYSNEQNLAAASSGSLAGEAYGIEGAGRIPLVSPPNVSPYNNDGSYNLNGNTLGLGANKGISTSYYNIVPILDLNRQNNEINHIASNIYLQVKPLPWITLRTIYGIDYIFTDNDLFNSPVQGGGNPNGSATANFTKYKRYVWDNTAQFDKSFGKHTLQLLLGNEQQANTSYGFGLNRTIISDPASSVIQAGFTTNLAPATSLINSQNYLVSFFGRLNYDFDKKYFLTATLRQDQYSAFGPNRKKGYFPGYGAKWEIAREKFWNDIGADKVFSSFQLRGSYGKVGNNAGLGDFQSYNLYINGVFNTNATLYPNQTGNQDLGWETSKKTDIGLNFGLLNDKITAEIAYYKNDISGLVFAVSEAPSAGLPTNPYVNVGSMYNKGLELTINAQAIRTKDFSWSPTFNLSFNQNRVTALAQGQTTLLSTTSGLETASISQVGHPLGNLYMVRTGGVDPATGRRIFINGAGRQVYFSYYTSTAIPYQYEYADGTKAPAINQSTDAVNYAQTQPKGFGGLNNNFRYKDFDLSFLFTYQFGAKLYYGTRAGLLDQRFWNNSTAVLNRWTTPGQITDIPKVAYNDNISNGSSIPLDINVFSSNFIKLKSMNFGYTLPKSLLDRVGISTLRFYVSGYNLFVITKYPGSDPEIASNGTSVPSATVTTNGNTAQGIDRNSVASARTLTAGFSVKF